MVESKFLRMDNPGKLVLQGNRISISFSEMLGVPLLWKNLKTRLSAAGMLKGRIFYSVAMFGKEMSEGSFTPHTKFERWAATPVLPDDRILEENEKLEIGAGLYAIFLHRGRPEDFPQTADFIFRQWLPLSSYRLDNRPHFEIPDPETKPEQPVWTEEIWIPVQEKDASQF